MRLLSRREMFTAVAATAAARTASPAPAQENRWPICAFSKHFQWTDVQGTADTCAELGYEAVDLTLRSGGHVEPARVADDLPKAVEIIRKAGLKVPMVTAGIVDARTPHAEAVVKTLASLNIRRYRWGGFIYDASTPIPEQLVGFKARVKDLAALNKEYGVCAMYHTHSGINQVGASMWDLYLLLKDFDPGSVSVNYDIGHATAEGGYGGWIHSTRLLLPYMRGTALKDFRWKQNAKGAWVPGWCALGQGMVNFHRFLTMIKEGGFTGPVQLHMEYPDLGGADSGKRQFTIPKTQLLSILRRDLDLLKSMLREVGMA